MEVMKSKGQNKTMSLLESAASVFAGYVITVLIQYLLYPLLASPFLSYLR
jgi:hypothetical protein